jgi:hypothetical protein
MDEKKINIDMNLFKFPEKTRKKREPKESGGIRVKTASQKKKDETLKKRSILKMIREHQEERYKKLFEAGSPAPPKAAGGSDSATSFNKEFKEAQQFMQSLADKKAQSVVHNSTVKRQVTTMGGSGSGPSNNLVQSMVPTSSATVSLQPALQNISRPAYGCLKGGELPTFRTLMNQTRKVMPSTSPSPSYIVHNNNSNINNNSNNAVNGQALAPVQGLVQAQAQAQAQAPVQTKVAEDRVKEAIERMHEMKGAVTKLHAILQANQRPKRMKRKKTLRRTYKIGKSKNAPKVSVLVSNRTIRSNITTQSQKLKAVPIEEVKRFLVKRGLIRVGSITPNDVLRKMYESAVMMCGEVHNHNPDNLLYNFLHDKT